MPVEIPYFADLRGTRVRLGELIAPVLPSDSGKDSHLNPHLGHRPVLMRTIGELNLATHAVDPLTTVSVAVRTLRDNGLRVLSVLSGSTFLGVVTREQLKTSATDMTVRELVEPLVIEMQSDTPVRTASRLFVENDLDFVPVMQNGVFKGLLTANQLLVELGRSWDPMTGLSWSDRLRDWGVQTLENGQELTLAFIDLNDFGAYNKRHGHIVGDRVLKAMARLLADCVDPETDVLVRYGGDEFVIGSIRPMTELRSLTDRLLVQPLRVEGVQEAVTFSIGHSGGKRSRERERTHFASTLDNLINLASQASLARKPRRQAIQEERQPKDNCVVEVVESDGNVSVIASISFNDITALATVTAAKSEALQAVADATGRALAKIYSDVVIEVQDMVVYRRWDGQPTVTLTATVQRGGQVMQVRSDASSPKGVYTAVADAVAVALMRARQPNSA